MKLSSTVRPPSTARKLSDAQTADKPNNLRIQDRFEKVSTMAKAGALGVLPAVGTLSNGTLAIVGVMGHKDGAMTAGSLGALANIAGTATLLTGLALGHNPTTLVGGSLLVASGASGAYAARSF